MLDCADRMLLHRHHVLEAGEGLQQCGEALILSLLPLPVEVVAVLAIMNRKATSRQFIYVDCSDHSNL